MTARMQTRLTRSKHNILVYTTQGATSNECRAAYYTSSAGVYQTDLS